MSAPPARFLGRASITLSSLTYNDSSFLLVPCPSDTSNTRDVVVAHLASKEGVKGRWITFPVGTGCVRRGGEVMGTAPGVGEFKVEGAGEGVWRCLERVWETNAREARCGDFPPTPTVETLRRPAPHQNV
ncbi:hypothetical protein HK104_010303, partial [Borealophlyctis nickersoniae]